MRFIKNSKNFLKVCMKCKTQFEDRQEWEEHSKSCSGAKGLAEAKNFEDNVEKVQTMKSYKELKEKQKELDIDNDFAELSNTEEIQEEKTEESVTEEEINISENNEESQKDLEDIADEISENLENITKEVVEEVTVEKVVEKKEKKKRPGRPKKSNK